MPFKPKKQSLATVAKQNGLEPLALDIFEGRQPDVDLATRATEFVRVDKGLNSVDDVINGVGHLLAERFSDNGQLRSQLRSVVWQTGKLSTTLIGIEPSEAEEKAVATKRPSHEAESAAPPPPTPLETARASDESPTTASGNPETHTADALQMPVGATEQTPEQPPDQSSSQSSEQVDAAVAQDPAIKSSDDAASIQTTTPSAGNSPAVADTTVAASIKAPRKKTRKKKKKKVDDPYKDYYDFRHPLGKIPYHRSLAINRGERAGRLKVKVQCDEAKLLEVAKQNLVAADHPFANFMDACVKDAITRLIGPSLEREVRRELTEAAERHAVEVFAHNLKNLLLQAPIRNQRVLAIDPGYKRGCSLVCLDSCGKVLASDHIFVVGNQQRKTSSKEKLVGLVNQYAIDLIAIGNGAACREAEQIVSDVISESFPNKNLKYAIVNEAGASFYSTSEIGREELPDASPAVRSAVSIGRRLIDPLSELVKISPANIGVGLYQHDVKAKHLSESLDEVVQFCVNRVGVNVNTASPSLLRYVSGLNQLTARRVVEYRQEHGAFKNRAQLKEVSGLGETTFIQSAGFLRIRDGDQPLDSTPIHPESYEIVEKIIAKIGGTVAEIFPTAQEFASSPEPDPEAKSSDCGTPTEVDSIERESNSADSSPEDPNAVRVANEQSAQNVESKPDATAPAESPTNQGGSEAAATANTADLVGIPAPESSDEPKKRLSDMQFQRRKELVSAIRELDPKQLADETGIGQMMMRDILQSICKPEFDPRQKINRPVFRTGILKIDDLKPEMVLDAQVVNVVDFGVFVDIGLGTSCLVHVSQLSKSLHSRPSPFFCRWRRTKGLGNGS